MLYPPVEMLQEIKHPFFVVLVAKKILFLFAAQWSSSPAVFCAVFISL